MFFLAGCEKSYFYSKSEIVPGDTWIYDFKPAFEVNITDIEKPYNIVLDITHSMDYPYQNIYFQFHATDPDGTTATTLVPANFANKGGVWYGNCDSEWCELEVVLQQNLKFNKAGTYRFQLEQYMRTENLEGIKKVGIKMSNPD